MDDKNNSSIFKEISQKIKGVANEFWNWLMPTPTDHWFIQILKSIAKLPLVLLLILCSPILIVVLLIIFLIAL